MITIFVQTSKRIINATSVDFIDVRDGYVTLRFASGHELELSDAEAAEFFAAIKQLDGEGRLVARHHAFARAGGAAGRMM